MRQGIKSYWIDEAASNAFRALILGVSLLLFGVFLRAAWFDFPNPYVDEAFFVPPALEFARSFSFHSTSLDPHRALHWMPVGHAVLTGLFIKASGVQGLWGARLFSTVAFGAVLCVLAWWARGHNRAQTWLVFLPFVTMPLLTLSRVARMESLFLLAALLCLLALHRRRSGLALGLAAGATLVHPNGALVGVAVVLCLTMDAASRGVRLVRQDLMRDAVWLGLFLAVVALHGVYEWRHGADFMNDMGYQFSRKARGFDWSAPLNWASLFGMGLSLVAALRSKHWGRLTMTLWGSALMSCRLVGQEMWYSPGYIVGLAFVLAGWLSSRRPDQSEQPQPSASRAFVSRSMAGVATLSLGCVFSISVFAMGWQGVTLSWGDHQAAGGRHNIEQAQTIVDALTSRTQGRSGVTVSCIPYEACLALWEPAQEAGFQIRLSNPLTRPPIGELCVVMGRHNVAGSAPHQRRFDSGPITSFEMGACPDADSIGSW